MTPPLAKAVVFDLDGTLLNTLLSLANCYNRVLSSHQLQVHDTDAYRHFIGNGAEQCLRACLSTSNELERLDQNQLNQLLAAQQADYRQHWQDAVTIYPGITELIETLQSRHIPLAVLTNKDQEFASHCVRHFFPSQPFSFVQGYSETVPHKPDPTGALAIVDALGLAPHEVVMVGDTAVDIATAKAAGLISVGVLWGFRDEAELAAAGADFIIERPTDLQGITPLSDC